MKNKIAMSIFTLSLVLFLIALYLNSFIILGKEEIVATLSVGEVAGFDANKTALTFGTINSKVNSYRNLTFENNYNFPIKIEFDIKGDIEEFLVFDRLIYLDVGEKKSIKMNAIAPAEKEKGYYSGKVFVVTKRHF
jgi:hypothetical protein